jgi:uncharacterized protein (DUF736 family)
MSDYQTKPNTGALFKNDKKETESHPDYRGNIDVNGVDHWISGWLNTSPKGVKYMSLKINPKEAQTPKPAPKQVKQVDDSQDIPW